MTVYGETMALFDDFLKTFYIPGIQKILNISSAFYFRMEKDNKSLLGKNATVPLQRGLLPVSSRGEGGTIGNAGSLPKEQAIIPLRYHYVLVEWTGIVQEASKQDIGAFISAMTAQTVAAQDSLKRMQNIQCVLDIEGKLTDSAEVMTTGAKTAESWEVDSTQHMYPGMRIEALNPSGYATRVTAGFIIDTITDSTHIKVTGTVTTQIEVDDEIFVHGNRNFQMGGLGEVFGTTNTYLNVVRTAVAEWIANINEASGVLRDLDLNMMQRAMDDPSANCGGVITAIHCREAMRRSYVDLLVADKRYTPPRLLELDGGFHGLEYSGGSNPVPVIAERDMSPEKMFFLDEGTFKMYRMGGGARWKEQAHGSIFFELLTGTAPIDAVRACLYVYQNMASINPRKSAAIYDLNES